MKKFAIGLMIAVLMFTMCIIVAHAETRLYTKTGIIFQVDGEENLITFIDLSDNLRAFEENQEWNIGGIIIVVFDSMRTENIFDDRIINIIYNNKITFVISFV